MAGVPPNKVRTFVAGPDVPAVSGETAADEAVPPGGSPAAPPSATPAAGSAGGDASLRVPPGNTQMDAIINGKGVSIPVDIDPLRINRGGVKAVADIPAGAAPARGRSPEPERASASGAGGAPSATDSGAAAADASVASAAPAKVPIPPTRPVVPTKAGNAFIELSEQKSEDAAKSAYHGLQAKFPDILGKLDPDIQPVDLGNKGVRYRIRIGPFAEVEAQNICGSYKAAGGDCHIAQP